MKKCKNILKTERNPSLLSAIAEGHGASRPWPSIIDALQVSTFHFLGEKKAWNYVCVFDHVQKTNHRNSYRHHDLKVKNIIEKVR